MGMRFLHFMGKKNSCGTWKSCFPTGWKLGIFFSKVSSRFWIDWDKVFSFIKGITDILHNFPWKVDAQPNISHSGMYYFFMVNQTCKNYFLNHHITKHQLFMKNIPMRRNFSLEPNKSFEFMEMNQAHPLEFEALDFI